MAHQKNSRVWFILSMVTFGTLGWFKRFITVTPGELALYRAVVAAVLLGIWFMISGQKIDFRAIRKEVPLLLLSGAAMGFNWILLFQALEHTTVSLATLSYYFAPVIVTVVCPIVFREKMGLKQWICFAMSTLGIVLITGVEVLSEGQNHLLGIGFGLGAAVLYAAVMLLNKFIKGVAGLQRTFLQFVAAAVVLVPYVAFTSGVTLGTMEPSGWVSLAVVCVIHTCVAYCLYFSAMKEMPGQEVAILSYVDPLVAVLISVFVLGEAMGPWQIVGGVLILGFTLWNEIKPKVKS